MVQAKSESKKRIGILGGTFDPAHIGHVKISKVAKKILKLDKIIWAITSKNPFKDKSLINIDCLLYTSPSPRDISGSRMPSSA